MVVVQRDPVGGLEGTHEKTKALEAEIVRASDQAGVIGAVLAHDLPGELQVGDVAQAIEQTEDLEHKLAESAAALADVSAELGREIKKRRHVTENLNKSQAQVERLSGAKKKKDAP
jgi:hypothetical protein